MSCVSYGGLGVGSVRVPNLMFDELKLIYARDIHRVLGRAVEVPQVLHVGRARSLAGTSSWLLVR